MSLNIVFGDITNLKQNEMDVYLVLFDWESRHLCKEFFPEYILP